VTHFTRPNNTLPPTSLSPDFRANLKWAVGGNVEGESVCETPK